MLKVEVKSKYILELWRKEYGKIVDVGINCGKLKKHTGDFFDKGCTYILKAMQQHALLTERSCHVHQCPCAIYIGSDMDLLS